MNEVRVWRIVHTKTGEFVPAPRNAMGVYATERGAKAGLTHLRQHFQRFGGRRGKIEDYEILPYYLVPEAEFVDLRNKAYGFDESAFMEDFNQ